MNLESAVIFHQYSKLTEENEYLRLLKLSEGIKQITQEILYMKSFTSVSTIKHLFYAYPFQPASVELIITGLFEHFQDEQFVYTFTQALMELATLHEIHPSGRRKSKLIESISLRKITNLQPKQYCREFYEHILEVKIFACSYLKQLFEKATSLFMDVQYLAKVFKQFALNSNDTGFLHFLIQKYEECKVELFGNHQWTDELDDEIIEYFQTNSIPIFSGQKQNSPINNQSSSSFNDSVDEIDEIKIKLETLYTNMQKWLCIRDVPLLKSRVEYLSDENHFEFLMSFIFNPRKQDTIKEWEQQFSHLKLEIDPTHYKLNCKTLTKSEVIRSYKTTQLFLTDDNFQIIFTTVPKLIPNMLYRIKTSLEDAQKTVNLQHIACILEKFLLKYSKSTVLMMVELNLFQILGKYIYNCKLASILSDISDIQFDRFILGSQYQEQLWKYFQKINWFDSILSLLEHNQTKFISLELEENKKIVQALRPLTLNEKQRIFTPIDFDDKQKLTTLLGTLQSHKNVDEFYNTNQLNWQINSNIRENISYKEIETKDIDGLKRFVQERDSDQQKSLYKIKTPMLKSTRLPQKQLQIIEQGHFQNIRVVQLKKPIFRPSHRKQCESVDLQCDTIRESANFSQEYDKLFSKSGPGSVRTSYIRYETHEDEIISPRPQICIYPGFKLSFLSGDFEKSELTFKINELYAEEVIEILKSQILSICQFLEDKHSLKQDQINFKLVANCLINSEILRKIFQFFLYGMMKSTDLEKHLSYECGIIINTLYKNVFLFDQLQDIKPILQDGFFQIADYLCKLIVKMYQASELEKMKQTLLITAFRQGYQLFNGEIQNQHDVGIHKYLHSTVIHILIHWFFQSRNNNIYQNSFLRFIIIIFVKAPVVILSSILFRLGFVGLLYDNFNIYCLNGNEHAILADSLLAHIKCIVYSINAAVINRQIMIIQQNLSCLDSWKKLIDSVPMTNLSIFKEISFLINPHFNFKHTKINLLNSQMSIDDDQKSKTPRVGKFRAIQQAHRVQGTYRVPKMLPILNPIAEKPKILSKTLKKN